MAQGYGEYYLPIQFATPIRTKNIFRDVLLKKVEAGGTPFIRGMDQSLKP